MAFEVTMPQLGLTMESGKVIKWLKNEGDVVKVGEALCEVETDKLTNELLSEFEGMLLKIVAPLGTDVLVQKPIAYIGQAGETVNVGAPAAAPVAAPAAEAAPAAAAPAVPAAVTAGGRVKISPLAKKTAEKMGIDYTGLSGSGPGGRIVQKDILSAPKTQPTPAGGAATASLALPGGNLGLALMEGDEVVSLGGMRKVIAQRMFKSCAEIPSVTTTVKVDVSKLLELRKKLNEETQQKYSINDFILKATVKALQSHRDILVSWDGDRIIRRARINLGVAVSLDEGLIVPVVRDADRLGLSALAGAVRDLSERARDGQLPPDDCQGSTFTVSNMGMLGIESFNPIINQPNSAILGVCAIAGELDLDENGKVFKKQVMRLCLTWDHRVMDGADAARFQQTLKALIETPVSILL